MLLYSAPEFSASLFKSQFFKCIAFSDALFLPCLLIMNIWGWIFMFCSFLLEFGRKILCSFASPLPNSGYFSFPLFFQSKCELGEQAVEILCRDLIHSPKSFPKVGLIGHWRQYSLTSEWLWICSKTTRV